MTTQNVHLNGGPWHGRTIALEAGSDHFHVVKYESPGQFLVGESEGAPVEVPVREGTYSQVRHRPGEFEWDGWSSNA